MEAFPVPGDEYRYLFIIAIVAPERKLSPGTPPADSMEKPVKPIAINANGIALITEEHFPGFILKSGYTLFYGYRGTTGALKVGIPTKFNGLTSMISGYTDPACCL